MLSPTFSLLLTLLPLTTLSAPTLEERRVRDGRFTFYPLKTPLSGPCDLERGPDGALWGEMILVNKIFRVDPQSGEVDEYPIPFTTPLSNQTIPGLNNPLVQDRTALSCAIRTGADGNLYAANGLRNQLLRINPRTKNIQVLQPPPNPLGNLFNFNDLYTAKDGIWFTQTTGNVFQFYSFTTQKFTTYNVPTPLALPLGCYVDSAGLVYIAELVANKILVFNPKTKSLAEYPLPLPLQFPAVIRAERAGWVYFSLFIGNGIGRINQKTHEIQLFHTNQTGGLGSEDTIDKYGGVWLSFFTTDVMARLDTNTLQYSYVPFPDTFASVGGNGVAGDVPPYVDIAVNYGPGDAIWFTSILYNSVGRYSLTGLYH
ncbi:hypothetical protein M409DRAFT_24625 [Zasmidium cellare ATCC 36951]|uniref:SMP-30/Gluconolactonase/LRE-like region domain-containing protein n=1 Tax=Zasmidium cellare ATCC 36951 TaxID=1080233 RepID=A0A6A6CF16_ZASCE|nr:uncharacterized protein M409DRAFT_24625 [Zasmidium cellare ATCC 36951]KAF2165243.1 hypothetical protein M409DRAFT_24625 [Zasmidium cellare ATCC 36951]